MQKDDIREKRCFARIGAAWFVSYEYYLHIDDTHDNFEKVGETTFVNRINLSKTTNRYHRLWLERIANMNPARLNSNSIGLSGEEVVRMAKELLCTYYLTD